MDMKQFLSWNLTAIPCVRLPELIRAGTAVLIPFCACLARERGRSGKTRKPLWTKQVIPGQ
jgi:hypothetical protein